MHKSAFYVLRRYFYTEVAFSDGETTRIFWVNFEPIHWNLNSFAEMNQSYQLQRFAAQIKSQSEMLIKLDEREELLGRNVLRSGVLETLSNKNSNTPIRCCFTHHKYAVNIWTYRPALVECVEFSQLWVKWARAEGLIIYEAAEGNALNICAPILQRDASLSNSQE